MPSNGGRPKPLPVLPPVRKIFRALVAAVVPEAELLDAPHWDNLEEMVEAALRDRPAEIKRQLRLALRGIQWLPMLRYGKPFTGLSGPLRARFLSSLENHRLQVIRVGFWGLRTLALLGYYARPEAAQEIGYYADPKGWESPHIGKLALRNRDLQHNE